MDIEQLKLILETLEGAGSEAKELALLYIGYLLLQSAGIGALLAGVIFAAYRLFSRLIGVTTLETELAKAMETYPPLSKGERERVIDAMKAWRGQTR